MPTTSNFGWNTPADTDLVKDGALAIRTLGNAIDSSFVDLKGGTTGQVLAKASNTDLDYTWVTQDDANAIQNAIVDAKGDLIAATANDTPARLAVGNNGETLVADSSASTGLRWQGNFAAGKNKIINGDFRINQRNFSSITLNGYGFDRWALEYNGGTATYSAQTFTPGTAPVAGYEGVNFARLTTASQSTSGSYAFLYQKIEDVRTFAGQTATISFWAKASSGTPKVSVETEQIFGTGGSPSSRIRQNFGAATLSTSWVRYTFTQSIDSISGKTLGTNNDSNLELNIFTSAGSDFAGRTNSIGLQNTTIDIWGVQIEAGNVATAFQTATGTLAGELAACQRYFVRWQNPTATFGDIGTGQTYTTTQAYFLVPLPVEMRVIPTSGTRSGMCIVANNLGVRYSGGTWTIAGTTNKSLNVIYTHGSAALTAGQVAYLQFNNNANDYVEVTAEL